MTSNKIIFTTTERSPAEKSSTDVTYIVDPNIPLGTVDNPTASMAYISTNYDTSGFSSVTFRPDPNLLVVEEDDNLVNPDGTVVSAIWLAGTTTPEEDEELEGKELLNGRF